MGAGREAGLNSLCYDDGCLRDPTAMIASDTQQRIDRLAEQLGNLRGYL